MGLNSWLAGQGWNPDASDDDGSFFERYDSERRAADPEYDRKCAAHLENVKLRERRDMLVEEGHNDRLRREIADLERRRPGDVQ